jgi:serine-type D-Ala-D-Ala carboxypeptidase (penicillin-binding protein 5/6)
MRSLSESHTAAVVAVAAALVGAALLGATGSPLAQPRIVTVGVAHRAAAAAPTPVVPAPTQPMSGAVDTKATNAFIIEAETGRVLLDKAADQRIPTASLSKMMTAYVVFSMLKDGKAKLTDTLPITETAWRTGGSKMFVPLGAHVSINDLIEGMIVQSGNDACVALAEGLAGSQPAFVDVMNQEAKDIGLTNSHFADVDGLPDPDHYMTARDMATLALHLINDFPQYYHYFSEKGYKFNNIDQGNRNPLLYKDIGADGLKTGHTEEAGYSLVGSLHRGNRRVILVLSGLPTMQSRAEEGERLADWAFREYNDYKLFSAGQTVDEAPVWLGTRGKVPLRVDRDVVVTLSRAERRDMKVSVNYDQPVPAPVRDGAPLGEVVVSAPGLADVAAPLYAAQSVPRMGPLERAAMVAAHMIWGDRN